MPPCRDAQLRDIRTKPAWDFYTPEKHVFMDAH
jgi:hypothetical protein